MDYQMPPSAYYAKAPAGTKIVTGGTQIVRMFCRGHSDYGCAITEGVEYSGKKVRCLIVVRNDVPAALHRDIVSHEIAHCNGWRH